MAKVNTSIGIDAEVKKEAQELLADLGLDITTAVNVFLRQTVRQQRIPFEIGRDAPNVETLAAIEEVRKMKANPSAYKGYHDVDEMMRDLLT